MNKFIPASQQVMQHYLSALLTDEPVVSDEYLMAKKEIQGNNDLVVSKEKTSQPTPSIEKLLASVTSPIIEANKPKIVIDRKTTSAREKNDHNKPERTVEKTIAPLPVGVDNAAIVAKSVEKPTEKEFQAMFFEVAGLTIAVSLVELGGIIEYGNISQLIGKPNWFNGVMLHRDEKINVIDTAKWMIPEQNEHASMAKLNYQFVIKLGNSSWGLTAENLRNTATIRYEDVKWSKSSTKKPWLAGIVKEHMCVLLNIKSLIKLLNENNN